MSYTEDHQQQQQHDDEEDEKYHNKEKSRIRAPQNAEDVHDEIEYHKADWDNKAHQFSFVQGMTDWSGLPLEDDDFYGHQGARGMFNAEQYPFHWPLVHDTNTTTALRFYDMAYQKTPLDTAEETEPNLSRIAQDIKESNLWSVQDFSETSSRRILEKQFRIRNDPDRKIQAQKLINMQKMKGHLLDPKLKTHPVDKLTSYNEMLLDTNIMLVNRLTDTLDYLEKTYMFEKYEKRAKGLNFFCELTLTSNAPATKINFTDDKFNLNVPVNAVMHHYPYHNLRSLNIMIISGVNLYYSTNEPDNQLDTYVKFDPASPPTSIQLDFGSFDIWSLNLRADGGDAVVRLLGLF